MDEAKNVQTDATTRRCDNPECDSRVQWTGGRGRPMLFCSSACRKRCINSAKRLRQDVESIEALLAKGTFKYREERQMKAELSRLEWLLSAYPESCVVSRGNTGQ